MPGFDKQRLKQLPAAAIRHVLQDRRIDILNIGMRLKEEIDANVRIVLCQNPKCGKIGARRCE